MKQKQMVDAIKKIIDEVFPFIKIRMIKIHGSKYQESGLPDLMIFIGQQKFWLELKRNNKDQPTSLQKFNVKDLADHGFFTGYIFEQSGILYYTYQWDDDIIINPIRLSHFFLMLKNRFIASDIKYD